MKKHNELPHLSREVIAGVEGTRLDSYLIALEAWRRGLTVQWLSSPNREFTNYNRNRNNFVGIIYTISSNYRSHNFYLSWGDKNTYEAYENTQNKVIAKKLLESAGINVPEGKAFYEETAHGKIIKYAEQLGYPLVLKPTNQGKGRGVVTNIKNEKDLKHSLIDVRENLGYKDVIIEKYKTGKEYRLYVINDKVVSAVYRKPPNVIGDGISSIGTLIKKKNKLRLNNPHIRKLPNPYIKADKVAIDFLEKSGYSLSSVPEESELVYLREKGNFSEGSDSIDVTDDLPPIIKETAVNALKAIPGLSHAGVDFIYDNMDSNNRKDSFAILEFNASAVMGSHVFPLEGKARDVPAEIIDFYFPETKGSEKATSFFDFMVALEPLKSRTASKVEVAPVSLNKVYAKLYTIYKKKNTKLKKRHYQRWLRNVAHELGLHGYIKNCIDGKTEILVAGSNKNEVAAFQQYIYEVSGVSDLAEHDYDKPVKIGFHLMNELNPVKLGQKMMGIGCWYLQLERSRIGPYLKPFTKIIRS